MRSLQMNRPKQCNLFENVLFFYGWYGRWWYVWSVGSMRKIIAILFGFNGSFFRWVSFHFEYWFSVKRKKTFSKAWQLGKTNRYKLVSKHKPFAEWPFSSLLCSIDVGFRRRTQHDFDLELLWFRLNSNDAECSFKRIPQLFVATHSIFNKWKVHKIQWYYTQKCLLKWFDTDDHSGWLACWLNFTCSEW